MWLKLLAPALVWALAAASGTAQVDDSAADPIEAVVAAHDGRPEALASHVYTEIELTPASGALKLPQDTLAARRGSSLERAQLLAKLTETAGYDTRIISFERPPSTRAALWEEAELHARASIEVPSEADMPVLHGAVISMTKIVDAIHEAGLAPETSTIPATGDLGGLATGYAVEYRGGNTWVKLGPEAIPANAQILEVGDGLNRPVTLTLILEAVEADKSEERRLAEITRDAAKLSSASLGIVQRLQGDKLEFGFLLNGSVPRWARIPLPAEAQPKSLAGSLAGAFGSINTTIGGSAPEAPAKPAFPASLALEIALGADTPAKRYTIWQLPKERQNAEGLAEAISTLTSVGFYIGAPQTALPPVRRSRDPFLNDASLAVLQLGMLNAGFHELRARLPGSSYGEALSIYHSEPSITITSMAFRDKGRVAEVSVDLFHKGYRVAAKQSARLNEAGLFFERIYHAALDAAAERALLHRDHFGANAASLLEVLDYEGIALVAHKPGTKGWQIGLPPAASRQITAPSIVMAPEIWPESWGSAPKNWWIVSAETGYTFDVDEIGRHSDFTEQHIDLAATLRSMPPMKRYACTIVLLAGNIVGALDLAIYVTAGAGAGEAATMIKDLSEAGGQICIDKKTLGKAGIPNFKTPHWASVGRGKGKGFHKAYDRLKSRPWRKNGRTFPG